MRLDVKARDVMHRDVVSVSPDTSLADIIHRMEINKISAVPVIGGDGLVGVVSKTDLVHYALDQDAWSTRTASTCMAPSPITCSPDTPITEVADTLRREAIHHVFVTEGGEVVGVVSSIDLIEPLLGIVKALEQANDL